MTVRTNEPELASKVAEWFNNQIKRGKYPFTSGTNETSILIGHTTRFGDIVLWKNRESQEAFSLIELKRPFESENLETFRQKAVALKVKYALTWNFQTLNFYKIKSGSIYLIESRSTPILQKIEDWLRGDVQALIKAHIRRICDELIRLNESGKVLSFTPDKIFFVDLIRDHVQQLTPIFEQFIITKYSNKKIKEKILKFAAEQALPYTSHERFFNLLARHRVYGLVTTIVFYLTVRKHFDDLPNLPPPEEPDLERALTLAFQKAKEKDWQAVFEAGTLEELGLPKESYEILTNLFSELNVYHFSNLPEDVIGELFEEIIDPVERHLLGQYFTNEDLIDIIIGAVVNDVNAHYADPTCGSGTFLLRLYDRIRYLSNFNKTHNQLLTQIWGIDIGKFPCELSTINLFRQNPRNFDNFPRVINSDIFDLRNGMSFEFPPPKAGKNYKKINLQLPKFHGLVGNFPYIRQELIEKNSKGYKTKLTKILAEEYFFTYSKLFEIEKITQIEIEATKKQPDEGRIKTLHHWIDKGWVKLNLSGQADIYTYIFIHTATLLSKNGALGVVTSNSWLDVSYGSVLKEFFLDHFKIKMIVGSWMEPWFEDVAVNTVFTILEREDNTNDRNSNLVHFVKLKKKLEDLIPHRDLQLESAMRWRCIDTIIRTIESSEHNSDKVTESISSWESSDMRIRLVSQEHLYQEILSYGNEAKWGKYIRAPDVYFEIIEKCSDKFVSLNQLSKVRFGTKTGINEFFYLSKIGEKKDGRIKCRNARGWEGDIEDKYLQRIIKTPREARAILVDPEELKFSLFICHKSKKQLRKDGDLGAFKYIEWGEQQVTKEKQNTPGNIPWPHVPSVQRRRHRWSIETKEFSSVLWPKSFSERFLIPANTEFLSADRFYEITLFDKRLANKLKISLNSTIQALFIEVNGRINLGEGALDNMKYEVQHMEVIDPKIIRSRGIKQSIFKRKIKPIFEELKLEDRQTLDKILLKALCLDPDEYLPKIYEGLCEMVSERLELPKKRKRLKKKKQRIAYDQIKESVIKDCLPDGVKKFPEGFYHLDLETEVEIDIYPTSGLPLNYESFFGHCTVTDSNGTEIFKTNNQEKAEYAVLLSKYEGYQIKIPKDSDIVLEVLKQCRDYIKKIREQLLSNANLKIHNWAVAEKMVDEIIREHGLIEI